MDILQHIDKRFDDILAAVNNNRIIQRNKTQRLASLQKTVSAFMERASSS